MSAEEKYEILAQDSHKKRLEMLEKAVYEFMEVSKVTTKAASAQQEEYQKIYKESAIKKQMELLQRELDEMHPEKVSDIRLDEMHPEKVSDIRKFEIKIEEAGMNETAKGEALKVLNRLKQESNGGTEAGMLYDYAVRLSGFCHRALLEEGAGAGHRPVRGRIRSGGRSLRTQKSEAAHHPTDRRHEPQKAAGGLDSSVHRRSGHRQDQHRPEHRESAAQEICAREPRRRARRS